MDGGIFNPAVLAVLAVTFLVVKMSVLLVKTHPHQNRDRLAQQRRALADLRRAEREAAGPPAPVPVKVAAVRKNAETSPAQFPLAS